jgi:hypothetical protein
MLKQPAFDASIREDRPGQNGLRILLFLRVFVS